MSSYPGGILSISSTKENKDREHCATLLSMTEVFFKALPKMDVQSCSDIVKRQYIIYVLQSLKTLKNIYYILSSKFIDFSEVYILYIL